MGKFRNMMTKAQAEAMKKREAKMNSISVEMPEDNYYYPEHIRFTAEQLPEIKDWKVGDEYEVTIKVTMKSYEERNSEINGAKKEKKEARFEIIAVMAEGKGEEGTKPEYGYVNTKK